MSETYVTQHFFDSMARSAIGLGLSGEVEPDEVAWLLFWVDSNAPSHRMGYQDSLTQRAAEVAAEAASCTHLPNWGQIMLERLQALL